MGERRQSMKRTGFELILGLTATVCLLVATACGGGGGGGGSPPPPPTPPQASLSFTPASGGSQNTISLSRTNVSTTELMLEVRAVSVSNLYGLGFDLTFPSNLLRFEEATEGTWLGGSGVQTSFLADESSGAVVVGLTRLGTAGGRGGSGTLMTLRFTAIGSGSGSLQFTGTEALNGSGGTIAMTWAGGSVAVQL